MSNLSSTKLQYFMPKWAEYRERVCVRATRYIQCTMYVPAHAEHIHVDADLYAYHAAKPNAWVYCLLQPIIYTCTCT